MTILEAEPQLHTHTENLILIDFDEVLFKAEGEAGYFKAWLGALAAKFETELDAEGLLDNYNDYKEANLEEATARGGIQGIYTGFDAVWRRDARNQPAKTQFDPVNYFRQTLNIEKNDFDPWLEELATPDEDGDTLASGFLHEGADLLWTQVTEAMDRNPDATQVLIYTQGGDAYQLHKIKASLGEHAASLAHVITSGAKGKHVSDSFDEGQNKFVWQLPDGRTITADRIALIDDNKNHLKDLPYSSNALGILIAEQEFIFGQDVRPTLKWAKNAGAAVHVLRQHNFLLAA
jgi:hypothetical protein